MRKHILLLAALCAQCLWAAPKIQQVEPLCWWTNMETPLTLMFHGEDLQDAKVSVQQVIGNKVMRGECIGLVPGKQHNAESPNYLFVDFGVFQPGLYRITLKKGNKKATYDYVINERRAGSRERKSFDASDVMYLMATRATTAHRTPARKAIRAMWTVAGAVTFKVSSTVLTISSSSVAPRSGRHRC